MKRLLTLIVLALLSMALILPTAAQQETLSLEDAVAVGASIAPADALLEEADMRFRSGTGLVWRLDYTNGLEIVLNATTGEVINQQIDDTDDDLDDYSNVTVTVDDAIASVYAQYPGTTIFKIDLEDDDDSRPYWEIWLENGVRLEVDAASNIANNSGNNGGAGNTGTVTPVPVDSNLISAQDALTIAQTVYPNATVEEIELDRDDVGLIWEVEFNNDRDVDVDARTGAILGFGFDDDDRDDNDDRGSRYGNNNNNNGNNVNQPPSNNNNNNGNNTQRNNDDDDDDDDRDDNDDDDDDRDDNDDDDDDRDDNDDDDDDRDDDDD